MSNPSASTHAAVYEGFEQDLRSLSIESLKILLQSIAAETCDRKRSQEISKYFTNCLWMKSTTASGSVAIPFARTAEAQMSVHLSFQQDIRSLPDDILKVALRFIAVETNNRNLSEEISKYFNDCLEDAEEFPISSAAASVAITRPFVGAVAAPFMHPPAAGGAAAAIACRWGAGCRHKTTCTFTHPPAAGAIACRWGAGCRHKTTCTFTHPPTAIACRNGAACPNKDWCRYSHLGAQ
jgi:hypothetical protein